jgi:hypothetical protein
VVKLPGLRHAVNLVLVVQRWRTLVQECGIPLQPVRPYLVRRVPGPRLPSS